MKRTFLYHKDYPGGRIFTDETEYQEAVKAGWVDAPWEVNNPDYKMETAADSPEPKKKPQKRK